MHKQYVKMVDEGENINSESTDHFCVFCCKRFKKSSSLDATKAHEKFYAFVSRHLNFSLDGRNAGTTQDGYGASLKLFSPATCSQCSEIIVQYCDFYHEIKCLELKLNWQLEKLWRVIRGADKIPSKVKALKVWLTRNETLEQSEHSEKKREKKTDSCHVPSDNANFVIGFRRKFKNNYKRYHSKTLPRVSITSGDRIRNISGNHSKLRSRSQFHTCTLTADANIAECSISENPIAACNDASSNPGVNDPYWEDCDSASRSDQFDLVDENNLLSASMKMEMKTRGCLESNTECHQMSTAEFPHATEDLSHEVVTKIGIKVESGTDQADSPQEFAAMANQFPYNGNGDRKEKERKSCSATTTIGKGRRSLRGVFKCDICGATFTSPSRLDRHTTEVHKDGPQFESSDEDDDDNSNLGNEATHSRHDNSSILIGAKKVKHDNDWNRDSEDDIETQDNDSNSFFDSEPEDNNISANNQSRRGENYTCTKCNPNINLAIKSKFDWHNGYFHTNGQKRIFSTHTRGFKLEDCKLENFPSESETRNHPCSKENCSKIFAISTELENHRKIHHGSTILFCQECKFRTSSAVELIDHELEHSDAQQNELDVNFISGSQYHCFRCDTATTSKSDFLNHCLEAHLNLPSIHATCPICHLVFRNLDQVPSLHYANCHDLRRLDDPSKPFRCEDQDCSAYFLTEDQLHVHWNKCHEKIVPLEVNIKKARKAERTRQVERKYKSQPKTHSCQYCSRVFKLESEIRLHVRRAHGKETQGHQQRIGDVVVSFPKEGLTINDLVFDKKAKYFCSVEDCKKGFMEELDLQSHAKLHGVFKCKFCDEIKKVAPDLALHELVHSSQLRENEKSQWTGSKFLCLRCQHTSTTRREYVIHHVETHLQVVMDKKRCPICRYAYPAENWNEKTTSADLKKCMLRHFINCHDLTEEPEKYSKKSVYRCEWEECAAYFRTATQLQEHVWEVHENVSGHERFKCKDCQLCFPSSRELKVHRVGVHKLTDEDLPFVCVISGCSERFEKEMELELHLKFAHPVGDRGKAFECPEKCGKTFFSRGALLLHLKTHVKKKKTMHICNECGRRCRTKGELETHKASHRRLPNPGHICEQCGKVFKTRSALDQHMQFHDGPESWKFSCSVCNKKVFSQQKLNEHMRTHTKEKPFICLVCGAAFAHRHNLRLHTNNKHESKDEPRKTSKVNMASSRKGKKLK